MPRVFKIGSYVIYFEPFAVMRWFLLLKNEGEKAYGIFGSFRVGKIKKENEALKQKLQLLHADEYFQISERLDKMNQEISDNNSILFKQREEISSLSAQQQKLDKQVTTQANKLSRYKELYRSVEYALDTFLSSNIPYNNCRLNPHDKSDFDCLALL